MFRKTGSLIAYLPFLTAPSCPPRLSVTAAAAAAPGCGDGEETPFCPALSETVCREFMRLNQDTECPSRHGERVLLEAPSDPQSSSHLVRCAELLLRLLPALLAGDAVAVPALPSAACLLRRWTDDAA